MHLTKLLEAARKGANQTTLSERLGVAQTTVSGWLRGISVPPRTRVPAIAQVLGLELHAVAAVLVADRKRLRARRRHAAKRATPVAP